MNESGRSVCVRNLRISGRRLTIMGVMEPLASLGICFGTVAVGLIAVRRHPNSGTILPKKEAVPNWRVEALEIVEQRRALIQSLGLG